MAGLAVGAERNTHQRHERTVAQSAVTGKALVLPRGDRSTGERRVAAPLRRPFRDGCLGPRPDVLLGSTDKWGHGSDGKGLLPIRSVRLGSDASADAEKSLKWLLAVNGYPVDGDWEHIEWENEDGALGFDEHFNEATAIQIRYSRHAYRDV